ncbi:MAG: HipA family kinase [bacterium]
MQTLQSIQTANFRYDTGDKPVLLLCSDMQDYVCKYALNGNARNLVCEYMAASFLKIWELPVPDFSFVEVNYEHVKHLGLARQNFEKTCFGSKHSRHLLELTQFTDEPDLKKFPGIAANKLNLLKIVLFDIWIANEDRNLNNMNLLVDVQNNCNLVPIDHGAVFNFRQFDGPMSVLTENDCLTDTDLMKHLYPKREFSREDVNQLKEYFYLCNRNCKQNLHEILSFIPPDWTSDLKPVTEKIETELFTEQWEEKVITAFLEYIHSPFN